MTDRPSLPGPDPHLLDDHGDAAGAGAAPHAGRRAGEPAGLAKAKELLLTDDYDGLLQVAEDQVNGGAYLLDARVALTERPDEDVQMSEVVKRISLTQPAPIQGISTEPEVIEAALEHIPGR